MILILIAEVVGAVLGVLMVTLMQSRNLETKTIFPSVAALCPAIAMKEGYDRELCHTEGLGGQLFLVEFLCTYVFITVIL